MIKPTYIQETDYGRFKVHIYLNGKIHHIGNFNTVEEATDAYNDVLANPERKMKYRYNQFHFSDNDKKKIMDYFWAENDNRDSVIAKHFNFSLYMVTKLISEELDIHFDNVRAKHLEVTYNLITFENGSE